MQETERAALTVLRQAASTAPIAATAPPLQSIFSALEHARDSPPETLYLRARPLAIDRDTLFPVPDSTPQAAQAVVNSLAAALADLPADHDLALARLFYALQSYAWALPSGSDPVVSLFDQARTEAAIAAARASSAADAPVLLLGGDISGVQDFIYTLTAEGATRALRGRSLYLQLLTEAVARWLLRQAGMPITNLLYSGGGRFYLILPATAESRIADWRRELGLLLLRRHAGELYVALGGAAFDAVALAEPAAFQNRWRALQEAITDDKRRRYATLPAHLLAEEVFAPQGTGGGIGQACAVCRYQGDDSAFRDFEPDIEAGQLPEQRRRVCVLCASLEQLARDSRNARYLTLREVTPHQPEHRERVAALDVLRDLGLAVTLATDERALERALAGHARAIVLGLVEAPSPALRGRYPQTVWGLRPLVNVTPVVRPEDLNDPDVQAWLRERPDEAKANQPGDIKTFGMLVAQSRGIKRLGVLRMDVDDLGDLFAFGLRASSLPRIAALSAALSRFFEGWVGALCRQFNYDEGERVYAVYSGGDDLFIVGSWDVLPRLAFAIQRDLQAYTRHPAVHVSAGISFHPAKFPLYQAAEAARDALDRAKGRRGKNALSFLAQVVGWEDAATVFDLYERLTTLIDEERWRATGSRPPLSRAALQVLQALYSEYRSPRHDERFRDPRRPQLGPWLWHGVYQLSRMIDERRNRSADNQAAAALLTEIRDRLAVGMSDSANQPDDSTTQPYIEHVGLAARWAQLALRKERE